MSNDVHETKRDRERIRKYHHLAQFTISAVFSLLLSFPKSTLQWFDKELWCEEEHGH